ncbi:hypothetical protein [Saliphagus infecundisoli]|uniref:Small CPxCG-related zinc finger protein n=1 Tax=Saliphagus infecundisoli TaxID=1849069 RepID=A0ABD5QES6_9EURY|nr:hypothetical protein [Saliphagus infecundisoli]
MDERRCPDCGVGMEETSVRTGDGMKLSISTGKREGLLGKLGVGSTTSLDAVRCPECRLVRLYAAGD